MTTPTPLPLDAAALDRWSALLARIIDHSDGTRPFAEVYDDELEPFIAQARAALTLRARVAELEANNEGSLKAATYWKEQHDRAAKRVAELERELNGVREASASELRTAYKRVAELEAERDRIWKVLCEDKAHANALRDALEDALADLRNYSTMCTADKLDAALAATPAASLAAYRKSVLEEAAKECEHGIPSGPTANEAEYGYNRGRAACASDIRALAAQAATHSVSGGTSEVKP